VPSHLLSKWSHWKKVDPKSLDPEIYGRVVDAWRHRSGGLLVKMMHLSRHQKNHWKIGIWYVAMGDRMLHRKAFYTSEIAIVPYRWATEILKLDRKGLLHVEPTRDPNEPTTEASKPLELPPL
jgi:hypothetical protein